MDIYCLIGLLKETVVLMKSRKTTTLSLSGESEHFENFYSAQSENKYPGGSLAIDHQNEEADQIFYEQLVVFSHSQALPLVRDFNLQDICWKYNTTERKQSRRRLENNFLTQ